MAGIGDGYIYELNKIIIINTVLKNSKSGKSSLPGDSIFLPTGKVLDISELAG